MNFAAGGDYVMVNTPGDAAGDGGARCRSSACGPSSRSSTPATSCCVKELIRDGLIDDPALIQLCMGIPYGAPDDPATLLALVHQLPPGCGVLGVLDRPHAAAVRRAWPCWRAATCGSGLEDNLYLVARRARPRTASSSSARVAILEAMNVRVLGPDEVRERLALPAGMS